MIDIYDIEDFIEKNSDYEIVDIEDCGDGEFIVLLLLIVVMIN